MWNFKTGRIYFHSYIISGRSYLNLDQSGIETTYSYVIWTFLPIKHVQQWCVTLLCLGDGKVNSLLGVTTTGWHSAGHCTLLHMGESMGVAGSGKYLVKSLEKSPIFPNHSLQIPRQWDRGWSCTIRTWWFLKVWTTGRLVLVPWSLCHREVSCLSKLRRRLCQEKCLPCCIITMRASKDQNWILSVLVARQPVQIFTELDWDGWDC